MKKYFCIHGHFYQPPREDPWSGQVPKEPSAAPFHDWNQRILSESYLPNAEARILKPNGELKKIFNNYSRMSFDFGPTLLQWLQRTAPSFYGKIVETERQSRQGDKGHSNAIAQAYNHMILPLASLRDKVTQVFWGIRDYQFHFGHFPEGMWLPETAVDSETLGVLARLGIRFTILAPHQARRFRWLGKPEWTDLDNRDIDPRTPYRWNNPDGDSLNLFFFHRELSQGVAFQGLLSDGNRLKQRILEQMSFQNPWPQILVLATDGETFGHHHRFGEMALAYLLDDVAQQKNVGITNLGSYLAEFPPLHEVEIRESTSWSCSHGIERWRSNCGCRIAPHPGWDQSWRGPLRAALDWLRDRIAPEFEKTLEPLLFNPWEARNDYVDLINDPSPSARQSYFQNHRKHTLTPEEEEKIVDLMEMQRHLMFMYTSCGWFFDDPAGIETRLILKHAARAAELAEALLDMKVGANFLNLLDKVKSNRPEMGTGRNIIEAS